MRETRAVMGLILILLLAGYLGVGGYMALRVEILASSSGAELADPVVVDGLEFKNRTQAAIHAAHQWLGKWCPFIRSTPHLAILAITCAALGALGAMVRAVYERRVRGILYAAQALFTSALLGALLGLLIFILAWVGQGVFPAMRQDAVEYAFPAAAVLAGLFPVEVMGLFRRQVS